MRGFEGKGITADPIPETTWQRWEQGTGCGVCRTTASGGQEFAYGRVGAEQESWKGRSFGGHDRPSKREIRRLDCESCWRTLYHHCGVAEVSLGSSG